MKAHALLAAALLAVAPAVPAATPAESAAKAEIRQLMGQFQQAIVNKDKAALESLFLPEGGAWFEVLGDGSYAQLQKKKPQAARFHADSHQKFAAFVVGSKQKLAETMDNVRIETDGAIATVHFDYSFLADGKLENQGSEAWQMVNTGKGWKISGMAYSSNPPQLH